jgi:hypothetical protein
MFYHKQDFNNFLQRKKRLPDPAAGVVQPHLSITSCLDHHVEIEPALRGNDRLQRGELITGARKKGYGFFVRRTPLEKRTGSTLLNRHSCCHSAALSHAKELYG